MSQAPSQHEDLSRDHDIETGSDRSFGIVFACVFALIGLWPLFTLQGIWPQLTGNAPRWWALAIALAFFAIAMLRPSLLHRANLLWASFGILIGKFITPIVMAVLYYTTVVPTGLLMRLCGKDPLNRSFDPEASSYWIERDPPGPKPDSMRDQF